MGLRDEMGLREGSIEKCSAAKKTMAKRGYGSRRGRGCKWYITSSDYIGRKEKGLIIISCMHIAYIPDTVTSKSGFERKLIPLRSTAAISLHRWFLRLTAGATNRQLLYQVDSSTFCHRVLPFLLQTPPFTWCLMKKGNKSRRFYICKGNSEEKGGCSSSGKNEVGIRWSI